MSPTRRNNAFGLTVSSIRIRSFQELRRRCHKQMIRLHCCWCRCKYVFTFSSLCTIFPDSVAQKLGDIRESQAFSGDWHCVSTPAMFPSKSRKFEGIRELAEYQDSMGFG